MFKAVRCVVTAALFMAIVESADAEDWPTFRGADRDAIATESVLLDRWPQDGPALVWETSGAGRGYASPALAAGRLVTLGDHLSTADDSDEYLVCFEAASGRPMWKLKTGVAWNKGRDSWQGSRGTPTIDGDRVYVITPYGKLICAATESGQQIWQKDLKTDLQGRKKDGWGYSESPLIDGGRLICTPGGEVSTVVALDKYTGDLIWSCARPDDAGAGHSSAVISHLGARKIYVQNTGSGPLGIDAETGELLWDYDVNPPTAYIPTPIIPPAGDLVYSVAGYGTGGMLLRQIANPDGNVTIEVLYGPKPKLANKHGGVVLLDGCLYFGGEDRNIVKCADLLTGETIWEARGSGERSIAIAAADGKLILRYQNGTVALVKADPQSYQELSTFKSPGSGASDKPSWAHPVVADGRLYLREYDTILCYQIGKQ